MKTPRGGAAGDTTNFDVIAYQKRKYECLAAAGGELNGDVTQTVMTTLRNALLAGQTKCRVQTLRLASNQYAYCFRDTSTSHLIYDTLTLVPYRDSKMRIVLESGVRRFTEWLLENRVHFICTTSRLSEVDDSFANFLHIVAVFIPIEGEGNHKGNTLWNNVYMQRAIGDERGWMERTLIGIRTGVAHFVMITVYYQVDYAPIKMVDKCDDLLLCRKPRDHLTMTQLSGRVWIMDSKFASLIEWVKKKGFNWTLANDGTDGCNWAYFVVLLDPLNTYF